MSTGRGAARGAGSASKRAFKPNLAVAGKRETPVQTPQSEGTSSTGNNRGSGNGRGGRGGGGRGRGARGGRGRGGASSERPALIQSEGIFSSGLNDERSAGRAAAGGFAESMRLSRSRLKTEPLGGREESITKVVGNYKDEWIEGDEDADAAALNELLEVGFISDLQEGDQVPLALPLTESHIFVSDEPVTQSAKHTIEEDSKEAVQEEIRKQRRNQRRIESESPTPELVGGGPIGQAFDELNRKKKNVNEPADFVFMQLPDTLSDMLVQGGKLVKKEPVAGEEPMEINVVGEDAPSTSTDSKVEDDSKHRRHCLDAFAHGTKLGRVQILKSGKARLIMGNLTLDLHLATPIDCLQEIVGIETPSPATPAQPIESGRLCVLGTVKHRMTASQDIESLVSAYRR